MNLYEESIVRATGRPIEELRRDPLINRTQEAMFFTPKTPNTTSHQEAEKMLEYALRK
jgi:hypothetical protein